MGDKMEVEAFSLSATLAGHEQDVRAIAAAPDGAVLTASRDSSVSVWRRAQGEGSDGWKRTTLLGHTHYVIAVASGPEGAVASGSNDKHVIEWDATSGTAARVLEGKAPTLTLTLTLPKPEPDPI